MMSKPREIGIPPLSTASFAISPPDAVPQAPPVHTLIQTLPFDKLSWENFERLCCRLTALEGDIDYCKLYGKPGEEQEGIDIFARQTNGRYHCLQAKRHRSFGKAKIHKAINLFLARDWASRAERFTLAIQASLRSTAVQLEIESQKDRLLKERGIIFTAVDGEDLSERLRKYPHLVDDFFGRPWVAEFLGQDVADQLGTRLDGAEFAHIRDQLNRIYGANFHHIDPGGFGSVSEDESRKALTLLERFVKPDILVREAVRPSGRGNVDRKDSVRTAIDASNAQQVEASADNRYFDTVPNSRMQRLPLDEWIGEHQQFVVLGDAGSGKSTLLRVIALDLLGPQAHFPRLATHWGQHLPLYVSFARWSSQTAHDGSQIGLNEIVRRALQPLLTQSIVDLLDRAIDDRRVLLLIDGLDEWSNEDAARATLAMLVTMVQAYDIPVIVSGRPRGTERIGAPPGSWKRGTVAPLSTAQQTAIAERWFERHSAGHPDGSDPSESHLRTNRFMAELARDGNLATLASIPVLLIGLVTLRLRGQILPRTKSDIYDELVSVLLEVHPDRRATAAGDTVARFRYAKDPHQRREAVALLAYEVRQQSGGGGMLPATARKVLRRFLASPQGFDLNMSEADAAAGEILSVNAETQGLIVEKGPGEIGFVHASFEEFLGAEHISGWTFNDIEGFVREHAGTGRWRNVITSVVGRLQRRDEIDRLIAIIESLAVDEVAGFSCQALLGDIAFGAATRAPASAKRLALATMHRVEADDLLPARREALASVLRGLSDPMLKTDVEQRIGRWLPARSSYRASLIGAFGTWQPTARLQDLLFQAMYDEDRGVQRAAAAAYAKSFSASGAASQRLLDGLACTRDLTAAAALVECLALGWPAAPGGASLFDEAWHSRGPELRLVGVLGLASIGAGALPDGAREAVLRCQGYWSGISYPHQELAAAMLLKYWPDDETLVKSALRRVSGNFDAPWKHEVAQAYLLESAVDHPDVRAWILTEFKRDHPPFLSIAGDFRRNWYQVGRFAAADSEIRAAANAYWCEPDNRVINMHLVPGYVAQVADPPVANAMIEVLSDKKNGIDRYWALRALIEGWGRDHPIVQNAVDALAGEADEDLEDLVSLIPEIILETSSARDRLIRMGTRTTVRRDLLALGLEACGCDGSDSEAVAALLTLPEQRLRRFDPSFPLFRAFRGHDDVRALARERLREADAPFAAIAHGYSDDREFAHILFDAAVPLPVDLRAQIIEVASTGASGTILETVLGQAMVEADPELRARMVSYYHRSLRPELYDEARQSLLAHAAATGPDYQSVRASALAGLVEIGGLDALASVGEADKPIRLSASIGSEGIGCVERLICERYADFEATFGDSLAERFTSIGDRNRLAEILSRAPGASPAARAAFLAFAERGEIPRTPAVLRVLSAERPRSDLLLARCWDTLDNHSAPNDYAMINAEVGLILRDHFPGDPDVRHRLAERFGRTPSIASAIALAIFDPDAEELPMLRAFDTLGHQFGDWALAVHVGANRADSTTFCKLLEAMVTRDRLTQFDAQDITNLAVSERLQRDSDLVALLRTQICMDVDPSISGSFTRYLAAAGKFNPDAREAVLELLQSFGANQFLPIAGYDAIADQWRAVRATLLDAVSVGLDVV